MRSENEQELRSTTDRPTEMPMPSYPIGWSSTGLEANPTQAYPAQLPYPAHAPYPASSGIQATAPYLSQMPQHVSLNLNSGVKLPSAPSQEMDSPPDFKEAMKMLP